MWQGPYCIKKNGENGPPKLRVRENTGNLDFFFKTQEQIEGILYAQVNSNDQGYCDICRAIIFIFS